MKTFPEPILLIPLLFCLLLTQCNWFRKDPQPELPPPTQEGKRTFGCRVNGQIWLPDGKGKSPDLSATYDPYYNYGELVIHAYRDKDKKLYQYIYIFLDSLTQPGTYRLNTPGKRSALFTQIGANCAQRTGDVFVDGTITLTRFNTYTRVVSGTFEFDFADPGCNTVRVTDGRFDLVYGF